MCDRNRFLSHLYKTSLMCLSFACCECACAPVVFTSFISHQQATNLHNKLIRLKKKSTNMFLITVMFHVTCNMMRYWVLSLTLPSNHHFVCRKKWFLHVQYTARFSHKVVRQLLSATCRCCRCQLSLSDVCDRVTLESINLWKQLKLRWL